jgi:hypothetical protein
MNHVFLVFLENGSNDFLQTLHTNREFSALQNGLSRFSRKMIFWAIFNFLGLPINVYFLGFFLNPFRVYNFNLPTNRVFSPLQNGISRFSQKTFVMVLFNIKGVR